MLIDVYNPNTANQGPSVFFMAHICIVLSNGCLYLTRAFFLMLFLPIGLAATSAYAQSGTVNAENPAGDSMKQTPPGSPAELFPIISPLPLLASAMVPVLDEEPLDEGDKSLIKDKPAEPITRKLPIWGQKAREKGYDLPLPFGTGANQIFMSQDIELRNVKVAVSATRSLKSWILISAMHKFMIGQPQPGWTCGCFRLPRYTELLPLR